MKSNHSLCNPALHVSRRRLLGAGMSGGLLSVLANHLAWADATGKTPKGRPKNVILLWMEGAPSQLETFDPHPNSRIGGDVKAVPTSVAGLEISEFLPQVAERMHLGSLVRSVTGKEGDHERAIYNVKTGYRPDPTLVHPSIGSIVCEAFPEPLDIPRHVSIAATNSPAKGGYLGAKYDAFKIDDPQHPVPDLKANVDPSRLKRRLDNLGWLEERFRRGRLRDLDQNRTLHESATDAAVKMMSSEQVSAFDVSEEPRAVLAKFGDHAFGRGCLAATRLLQAGVRCVEITLGGWDSHINNHALQRGRCEILDPALAALLDRLEEQEMLDHTLVVCGGEFGRTPNINPAEGRDHWPHGFSTFLAGCNIRRGGVFGATSPDPNLDADDLTADVKDPVRVADLHATILSALDVPYAEELMTPIGRPLKRSEGRVIDAILK